MSRAGEIRHNFYGKLIIVHFPAEFEHPVVSGVEQIIASVGAKPRRHKRNCLSAECQLGNETKHFVINLMKYLARLRKQIINLLMMKL